MQTRYLIAYLGAAAIFLLLDFAWLMAASSRLYKPVLGSIFLDKPRLTPAIVFYAVYLAGMTLFAIAPALKEGSWTTAAMLGAALGLVAYGTYDLTNEATIAVWQTKITIIDLLWGSFVTASGATAGYFAGAWWKG